MIVQTLACGGTYAVPIGGVRQTVIVTSNCQWSQAGYTNVLPGTKITVSKGSLSIDLAADADGKAYWYPSDGTGSYTVTIVHPSGRFQTAVRTVNVTNACTAGSITVQLLAAAGFDCCGTQLVKTRIPHVQPLTVVTSGGQTLTPKSGSACIYEGTWSVPVPRVGGVPQKHTCSPGVAYDIPPTPPTPAT